MDLFRDCLDQLIVDRNDRRMGRVDGIILEVGPAGPPRVAAIEVGASTLVNRAGTSLGRAFSAFMKRFRLRSDRAQVPWSKIRVGLNQIHADIDCEDTPALAFELWLRKKVVGRIPGA